MAKVKKMAFGGMGGMGSKVAAAAKALPTVAPAIYKKITNAAPQNMNAAFNASNLARAAQMNSTNQPEQRVGGNIASKVAAARNNPPQLPPQRPMPQTGMPDRSPGFPMQQRPMPQIMGGSANKMGPQNPQTGMPEFATPYMDKTQGGGILSGGVAPAVMPRGGLGSMPANPTGPRTMGVLGSRPTNPTMSGTPKTAGIGAAMSGPKTGLGTAMGMNKMGGAGAALGKSFGIKKGGAVKAPAKKMASGGKVSSASKRADGIAQRGKTRA